MTLRQRSPSSNGVRRTTLGYAVLAALAVVTCDAGVLARPRTWANQDMGTVRQPGWMPFLIGDRNPHPAVAQITGVEGNAVSRGCGTLVEVRGNRGLIVTNWHVIRDAKGPVIATFPDGFRSAATVLKVDADWDLAALLIWRPSATPVNIAPRAPRPGDPLVIAGYGAGNYRALTGRCTQYVAPGMHMPYEMVEVSAEARQGDSGGPILNQRGELAGVLFGAGGGTTSGSFCGRVRKFLDAAWPVEPFPAEDTFVSLTDRRPNIHRPSASLLADSRVPSASELAVAEPAPHYAIGSPLTPATIPAVQRRDGHIVTSFQSLAGNSPGEQAKTMLAVIGILAIFVQVTRAFRSRTKEVT